MHNPDDLKNGGLKSRVGCLLREEGARSGVSLPHLLPLLHDYLLLPAPEQPPLPSRSGRRIRRASSSVGRVRNPPPVQEGVLPGGRSGRASLCLLPGAAAGPGQVWEGEGVLRAFGLAKEPRQSPRSFISPWSSSPPREVPPGPSSRPPQVALATFRAKLVCQSGSVWRSHTWKVPRDSRAQSLSAGTAPVRAGTASASLLRSTRAARSPLRSSAASPRRPRRRLGLVCLDAELLSLVSRVVLGATALASGLGRSRSASDPAQPPRPRRPLLGSSCRGAGVQAEASAVPTRGVRLRRERAVRTRGFPRA